jgi:hypothetical protein
MMPNTKNTTKPAMKQDIHFLVELWFSLMKPNIPMKELSLAFMFSYMSKKGTFKPKSGCKSGKGEAGRLPA